MEDRLGVRASQLNLQSTARTSEQCIHLPNTSSSMFSIEFMKLCPCIYISRILTQEAFAIVYEKELTRLNKPDSYFPSIAAELGKKRDFMINFLKSVGMKPIVPQGGYFLVADWSALGEYFNRFRI